MLQGGGCPLWAAPFFTLHIPADINFLWLLSALELLNLEVAYRKKEEQPHGCPPPKKNVLCYIETELNSAPMRCIAATIFFVVFSPGNAAPLLYCLILLSLIPAY